MRFLTENHIRSDFFIGMVSVGFMYVDASRGRLDEFRYVSTSFLGKKEVFR